MDYSILNPEFKFSFDGKEYLVRKANLEMAILYQQKVKELSEAKDSAADQKIAAFCLWLVLKEKEPNLTEAEILNKTPADLDVLDCLVQLGFISPSKMETARRVEKAVLGKLTSDKL